jgi:hypothetical protein
MSKNMIFVDYVPQILALASNIYPIPVPATHDLGQWHLRHHVRTVLRGMLPMPKCTASCQPNACRYITYPLYKLEHPVALISYTCIAFLHAMFVLSHIELFLMWHV